MILTIDIDKQVPGVYVARATQGGVLVTEPEKYGKIEEAIRQEALNVPPGFAHFLEFTYGGMSTGTFPVQDVPAKAGELADRLVYLIAQMHEIDEQRSFHVDEL